MFQKVSGIPSLFHCAMAIFEAAVEAALRRATPSNHGSTVNVCCFRFGMLEPLICLCGVCRGGWQLKNDVLYILMASLVRKQRHLSLYLVYILVTRTSNRPE